MSKYIGILKRIRVGRREGALLGACLILLSVVSPTVNALISARRYVLADSTRALIGGYSRTFAGQVKFDAKEQAYTLNADAATSSTDGPVAALAHAQATVGASKKADEAPYGLKLHKDFSKGMTMTDANMGVSFDIVPQFKAMSGMLQDQRVVYPVDGGSQAIYSIKGNGLKEDIVLPASQGNEGEWRYQLKLPKTLQARLQADGSVGIFSADPLLFGNISFGSNSDQAKVESAREHAAKDHLVFVIPAPTIRQSGEAAGAARSWFTLGGTDLTVHASGLAKLHYPISVDPSVVVTSASDFATGNNETNIDYSTAGQIGQVKATAGTVGTWSDYTTSGTNTFTTARGHHGVVAYNGYLYIAGGQNTDLAAFYNDVQCAPINADGTLGTWQYTYSSTFSSTANAAASLPTNRMDFGMVAYNGYMYIVGGSPDGTNVLASVIYAPINANGTIGTWITNSTSLPDGRQTPDVMAYNGYLYSVGGWSQTANVDTNDVFYAPINADGTVGTWVSNPNKMAVAREGASGQEYNGYLYVLGGYSGPTSAYQNTVEYAQVNADGSVGVWKSGPAFTNARVFPETAIYGGYLYIMCGLGTSSSTKYFDTQYAPIYANGSLGAWSTSTQSNKAMSGMGGTAYNGYVYMTGGVGASVYNDTQIAKIGPSGTAAAYATTTAIPTISSKGKSYGRYGQSVVAYNSYLYLIGGLSNGTAQSTTYYAALNANGTVGAWTATTALPSASYYQAAVAYNGYLYISGGYTGSAQLSGVYSAPINATGTLGSWSSTNSPGTGQYGHTMLAYNGYLYIVGGLSNTAQNSVLYAAVNSDGSVAGWTSTSAFTTARYWHSAAINNGYLYVIGGYTGSSYLNDVQFAPIQSGGTLGAFQYTYNSGATSTQAGGFANTRAGLTAVVNNGYLYLLGGYNGTTYYNDTQYAPINVNGTIGTWATTNAFTSAREYHSSVATNGYVYAIGGWDGSTYYSDVQYARLADSGNGSVGTWTTNATSFTTARSAFASTVYNGYLYIYGGKNTAGGAPYLSDVQYAKLNTDGSVGAWTVGPSLNSGREFAYAVAYNGYLYVAGGFDGTSYFNDVQYAPLDPNTGAVGTWKYTYNSASTTSFVGGYTTVRGYETLAINNGYLYLVGGANSGTVSLADVQYAPINADGTLGTWVTSPNSLATSRYAHSSVIYNGYLYVMGGMNKNGATLTYLGDVVYAKLNPGGGIGPWQLTSNFKTARYTQRTMVVNGYMFMTGGYTGTTFMNDIQYAPINPDGSLGAWVTGTSFTTGRADLQAQAWGGNIYIFGGTNGTVFYGDIQYVTPGFISLTARYSKLIDLGAAVNVTGVSYNGVLPGGLGAITYRAAGANGVFGTQSGVSSIQSTSACSSTLSGVRYLLVSVTLDDGITTAGVPPTQPAYLSDFTVNYSAGHPAPNVRLRAGQTLQNGVLSSLDVCAP